MQKHEVENFFSYSAIVLVVIIGAFISLQVFAYEELAFRIGIIGAIMAFLFGITGLVLKKRSDNQKVSS